jgi:hypothetical protein
MSEGALRRSIHETIRTGLTWEQLWRGPDNGLICCWERGRQKRSEDPQLAACASAGELVVLAWRGGVQERLKSGTKYGTLQYLATWQGLRGEDLNVRLDGEQSLVCSRTGQLVIFRTPLPDGADTWS